MLVDILPGSDDVYNWQTGKWETLASGPNYAPNMAYIGWGLYCMKTVDDNSAKNKAAWSACAHIGGKDHHYGCLCIHQDSNHTETVTLMLMSGLALVIQSFCI